MKPVKEIVKHIRSEIRDAENYAKAALIYKDDDRLLSEMYKDLALQELDHQSILHRQVQRIIDNLKRDGSEIPAGMMEMWQWHHEQSVEDVSKIKSFLDCLTKN